MSQQIPPSEEDPIYGEMRSILKPMINSALSEKPKDPVIIFYFIFYFFYRLLS